MMLRGGGTRGPGLGLRRAAWTYTPTRLPHQRALASRRPPVQPPSPPRRSALALVGLMTTMYGVKVAAQDPQLAGFVAKHFIVSREQLRHGRVHTLVTSTLFSRAQGINLVALAFFGREACRMLGGPRFLALFFASGALTNVVTLALEPPLPDHTPLPFLMFWGGQSGAAGAVDCVVTLNALLYPPSHLAMSRRWLRWVVWFYSVQWLLRDEPNYRLGFPGVASRSGHFTGACCGVLAFLALRRRPHHLPFYS